jgi:hypothetical protein
MQAGKGARRLAHTLCYPRSQCPAGHHGQRPPEGPCSAPRDPGAVELGGGMRSNGLDCRVIGWAATFVAGGPCADRTGRGDKWRDIRDRHCNHQWRRGRDEIPQFWNYLRCISARFLEHQGAARAGAAVVGPRGGPGHRVFAAAARPVIGRRANERACARSNGPRRTAAPKYSVRNHSGSRSGGDRGCAAVRHNCG